MCVIAYYDGKENYLNLPCIHFDTEENNSLLGTSQGFHEYEDIAKVSESISKMTGYSVYSKVAKEREKKNTLQDLYPPLPDKKFDIIFADPPWDYNGKLQFDKSSTSAEKMDWKRNIFISSASFKYPTLKVDELKKMPVDKISKEDSLLFMWTSNPHLAQAIELGQSWG